MRKSLFILLLIAGFVSLQQANAQVRIGYTNPARVLNELPEVDTVDQQIQELIAEKDNQLATKAGELQQILSQYEENKASLSEQERQSREEELIEMNRQFEAERESYLKEVRDRRNQLMRPIIEKMNRAMEEVAGEMNLDLVLNEGTSYGDAIIFYAESEGLDITSKIIAKIKQS